MATKVGLKRIFISAPYVEAMFQIWWRLVHKWHQSLVHRCRRPETETGHWGHASDFIFCPMLLCIALDGRKHIWQFTTKFLLL